MHDEQSRGILEKIANHFFPTLEKMMVDIISDNGSPHQLVIMRLIAKIFLKCNQIKLLPFLIKEGRMNNWIEFIAAVLESQ